MILFADKLLPWHAKILSARHVAQFVAKKKKKKKIRERYKMY